MQTVSTSAVILMTVDELEALIDARIERALTEERAAREVSAARTKAYSLNEVARKVGVSTKTAAARCRAGSWPDIQAGTDRKPRYRFAPEHLRQIQNL